MSNITTQPINYFGNSAGHDTVTRILVAMVDLPPRFVGRLARVPEPTRGSATGKPTGACAGCAVDLIIPLKRGGLDTPSNMRRQTIAGAKAKNSVE